MELLNRLFQRDEAHKEPLVPDAEYPEPDEDILKDAVPQSELNIKEPSQRREYVENCLMRMSEGAREMDALRTEYAEVTAYLHDMDEIRGLSAEQKQKLTAAASAIRESEERREEFIRRSSKMTDAEYARVERMEGDAADIIRRFESAEEYHRKIKSDLKRLDNEHEAYLIREEDLTKTIKSTHFLSIACMAALIVLIALLFVLHLVLHANVVYGYMLSVVFAGAAILWLYIRNSNAAKELKSVQNTLTRLILLQNTVKIRYVNNRNLLDYYILKYGAEHSAELKELVGRYRGERSLREAYSKEQDRLTNSKKTLVNLLTSYHIRYPDIWAHQPDALRDEEKEESIRRDLMKRRQQLRGRMDYNQDKVIDAARNEIRALARDYPQYADEITSYVDQYTAKGET